MAAKKNLPHRRIYDEEHVVRRCWRQGIDRDRVTGQIRGIHPAVMKLRPEINETYLSLSLLEHCPGTEIDRLRAILALLKRKMPHSNFDAESGLAIMNALRVRMIGRARNHTLSLRYTPSKKDPAYSRLSGLPYDNSDMLLLAELAAEASRRLRLLSAIAQGMI
jgi:hypothetical protein